MTVTLSGNSLSSVTSQLNLELNLLKDWAIHNLLTINTDKTEFRIFSNKTINIDDTQLKIGRDKLTHTTSYNFLGINPELPLLYPISTFQRYIYIYIYVYISCVSTFSLEQLYVNFSFKTMCIFCILI